jgi:hypothetical protein
MMVGKTGRNGWVGRAPESLTTLPTSTLLTAFEVLVNLHRSGAAQDYELSNHCVHTTTFAEIF